MTLIDLTRQRFGKLTVTGSYHRRNPSGTDEIFWTCKCDCGGTKDVRGFSLRCGDTTSCGCVQLETVRAIRGRNILGVVFGRLTVMERIPAKCGKRNTHFYTCMCACGKSTTVQRSHLVSGATRSCGCLQKEMNRLGGLPRDNAGFNAILRQIKKSARNRGYSLELSEDMIFILVTSDCYYCGLSPNRQVAETQHMYEPSKLKWNGIDRVDSLRDYTLDNVVACCTQCNYAKRNYSSESFIEMCRRVAERHPRAETSAGASAGLL